MEHVVDLKDLGLSPADSTFVPTVLVLGLAGRGVVPMGKALGTLGQVVGASGHVVETSDQELFPMEKALEPAGEVIDPAEPAPSLLQISRSFIGSVPPQTICQNLQARTNASRSRSGQGEVEAPTHRSLNRFRRREGAFSIACVESSPQPPVLVCLRPMWKVQGRGQPRWK